MSLSTVTFIYCASPSKINQKSARSHVAAVPLRIGETGVQGFLDLREKVIFLNEIPGGPSAPRGSSF
jgi:hypothetical protein